MRKIADRMDAQLRHNQAFLVPKPERIASREVLEASLTAKNGPSQEPPQPKIFDPLASAVMRHPGLTSERAAEIAEAYGF